MQPSVPRLRQENDVKKARALKKVLDEKRLREDKENEIRSQVRSKLQKLRHVWRPGVDALICLVWQVSALEEVKLAQQTMKQRIAHSAKCVLRHRATRNVPKRRLIKPDTSGCADISTTWRTCWRRQKGIMRLRTSLQERRPSHPRTQTSTAGSPYRHRPPRQSGERSTVCERQCASCEFA